MLQDELYQHYQDLQAYVAWSPADVQRIRIAGQVIEPQIVGLIDDFYAEIVRHPAARIR